MLLKSSFTRINRRMLTLYLPLRGVLLVGRQGAAALLLALLWCSVCWQSCSYSNEAHLSQHHTTDAKANYQLAYPDYMKQLSDRALSATAPTQFVNYFRNVYSVLNDTIRTDSTTFDQYAHEQTQLLISRLQRPQKIDSTELRIDGKRALKVAYTGTVGKEQLTERMYYELYFIDGQQHCYQLSLWTWDKWRSKYLADFQRIATSFDEQ